MTTSDNCLGAIAKLELILKSFPIPSILHAVVEKGEFVIFSDGPLVRIDGRGESLLEAIENLKVSYPFGIVPEKQVETQP